VLKLTKKKALLIYQSGKRKRAVASASAQPGSGEIIINNRSIESFQPEAVKLMMKEPIMVAEESGKNLDITVNVKGGGIFGQASAVRLAIAKILVENDNSLREKFLNYDRTMLVADFRRTEPHHPGASKRGSRRHKQRSKR
jgi:small subunit ribosomal protein S9